GLGRTGKLFGYQNYDIEPDIMAIAKALGNGIPCGAILAKEEVAQHFTPGSHGTTFGGNPLAMSSACTVIETIVEEDLLTNCNSMGNHFLELLDTLKNEYKEYIKEVRGKGLILGIEFFNKEFAKKVFQVCIDKGLLLILTIENVFRILPPLNTSIDEVNYAIKVINESIKEVIQDG
ncbi:MAG: aminotransferase class III-fold pyridoxal phosphate-dependent enzyme, partial [Candidatus Dadabacteria bacterium]|nr:aminotransferase class III-fold pyridoxal phosphate-dependent enzyme [Candidatus Dadabacteria bacterium]NIQ16528.1 aminotransferase class III-fold pyridoxal phosphate-dependent enzyme [Candidatus Dadabacteria bacterium]